MTPLGKKIVERAWYWFRRNCAEAPPGSNGGVCIDEIQEAFYGTARREPWCATAAWVWVQEACQALGVRNHLPKTAGALDMLRRAEQSPLRVDASPAPGAVGYRKTCAGCGSGHIVVVTDVQPRKQFSTIEGNSNQRVDRRSYPWKDIAGRGFRFMHTEAMPGAGKLAQTMQATAQPAATTQKSGTKPPQQSGSGIFVILGLGLVAGLVYAANRE